MLAFAAPRPSQFGTLTKSVARRHGQICAATREEAYETFDHRRRVLFVLGAQKGGSTWLFNALTRSPHFVGALHTYGYVQSASLQSFG